MTNRDEVARRVAERLQVNHEAQVLNDPADAFGRIWDALISSEMRVEELIAPLYTLPKFAWNPGSCCGDAHMELMSAKSHLKALGFEEECTEKPDGIEILWRNVRAEKAEARVKELELQKEVMPNEPAEESKRSGIRPQSAVTGGSPSGEREGAIEARVKELESPQSQQEERMYACLKCGAESWRAPSAKLTRCENGECAGQIVANPRRG